MLNHKQLEAIIELIDDSTPSFEIGSDFSYDRDAEKKVWCGTRSFTTLSAFINWVRSKETK